MSDNFVSVTGNVARDPELRYVASGKAVLSFAVAHKPYSRDGEAKASFFDVTAWEGLADNAATTLEKGMRVTVVGKLRQESWETDDGGKRSRVVIVADSIAPDLRWATANVERADSPAPSSSKASSGKASGKAKRADYDEEPF